MTPLHAIVDAEAAASMGWTAGDLARAFLDGGALWIQVRAKHLSSGAFLDLCDDVVRCARPCGATVVVNDRADVARACGAAGVHVGQEDLPPAAVRGVLGPEAVVGFSTHTIAQVNDALREPVSYIAVGPVFGTSTKATGYEAVGLDLVSAAASRVGGRPLVAIGGITIERAVDVIAAGASAVAVISDLLVTGDPRARTQSYLQSLSQFRV